MRTRRENCLLSSESPSFRAAEQIIRRLKSGRRERNFWMQRREAKNRPKRPLMPCRDRKAGTIPANIPAETAYLEFAWKPVVRSDWMVVCAVRYEQIGRAS